jgi:hypothetical protein
MIEIVFITAGGLGAWGLWRLIDGFRQPMASCVKGPCLSRDLCSGVNYCRATRELRPTPTAAQEATDAP